MLKQSGSGCSAVKQFLDKFDKVRGVGTDLNKCMYRYLFVFSNAFQKVYSALKGMEILDNCTVPVRYNFDRFGPYLAADPHSFFEDPDPADFLNADPEPEPALQNF